MEKEEIIEFIQRRFSKDCDWLEGNCYWFAVILCARFPQLQLWYLPVSGHFVAGALGTFFDWSGQIVPIEIPILVEDIEKNDPTWAQRLGRDCVL